MDETDDFIRSIARWIKSKEDDKALAQRVQLHRAGVIRANAPAWFDLLADELARASRALNAALLAERTASADAPFQYLRDGDSLRLEKADFPHVRAELVLNLDGMMLTVTMRNEAMPFKFDIDEKDNLFVVRPPARNSTTPGERIYDPEVLVRLTLRSIFSDVR